MDKAAKADLIRSLSKAAASFDGAKLLFLIGNFETVVKAKCNRDDIPEELDGIIVQMVIDYIEKTADTSGSGNVAMTGVQSISRGDTTITYASNENKSTGSMVESFVMDYAAVWRHFRKARGVGS